MKNFNQKMLSATVSMLMTMSIAAPLQASDIEIYKLPDQTELTVFMMLDTSGSMDIGVVGETACDLKSGQTNRGIVSGEISANGYTRNYCRLASGTKTYYYRSNSDGTNWKKCSDSGSSTNRNDCNKTTGTISLTGMVLESRDGYRYYYNYGLAENQKAYDRISRLKDALYTLATSNKIPENTRIGIGTYPYVGGDESNRRGRVRVPIDTIGSASPLSAQRRAILNLISGSSFYGTGGTPTSSAYAESAAYLLGTTTGGGNYSGTGLAPASILSNSRYIMPLKKEADPKCSGKGIYFLTDGQPQTPSATNTNVLMANALGMSSYTTSVRMLSGSNDGGSYKSDWSWIGGFAKSLNTGSVLQKFFTSPVRNNEHVIKTAVVGFGSVFDVPDPNNTIRQVLKDPITDRTHTYYNCSLISGNDAKNACNWGQKSKFSDGTLVPNIGNSGGYGEGGFYSASSTDQVVQSLVDFVADMKPEFDPIVTGSPTLPIDALNPIQIQPYGYYAEFTPEPQEKYQIWFGNLDKYHIYNGALYNEAKTQRLIKDDGSIDSNVSGLWGGGVQGQLPLGTLLNPENQVKASNRKVFTNREIKDGTPVVSGSLNQVNLASLFDTNGAFANDPKKNYWLNALGYAADINTTWTLNNLPTDERRQIGAVMHSTPILLTQQGKIVVPTSGDNKGQVTTTNREDYLLFGTNQGMLHVVKAGDENKTGNAYQGGKEIFTFVPHEMMEKQYKAFLNKEATDLGTDQLYYGVDGPWTAFTQYVSKEDGTLTVQDSGRKNEADESYLSGLQWVYGGLRMGGKSYYALDLTDIEKPELKFHIDPVNSAVHSSGYDIEQKKSITQTKTYAELSHMGESWSKPTLTYVNWDGDRKLVMIVGGGYDREGGTDGKGYENPAYNQANKKGAGIYMFDAENGDLLWWASANATAANSTAGVIASQNNDLKYSVVSQINAVDRNGDGLSDHLYFGDLGGQAFRIDLNNNATSTSNFTTRIVRLYNANVTTGASPRFYEMPSFSVHDGVDGAFGVLALSSGNRSSPLAGTRVTATGDTVITLTANDAVYVVYDNDVARSDLYDLTDAQLRSKNVSLEDLVFPTQGIAQTTGTGADMRYIGGWKYHYSATAGKYKGMNEIYALDSMLYVNVYHKDGKGIAGDCGSGVIGDSELYQFCLPTGKCDFYTNETKRPNSVVLGGGILGTGLGQGYNNVSTDTSLVLNRPDDPTYCDQPENKNKPECQLFDTSAKLQHLRWYELR